MIIDLAIGAVLALIPLLIVKKFFPKRQVVFWQFGLLIAALAYIGFVLINGKDHQYLPLELGGLAFFSLLVFLSNKYSLYFLSLGWAMHIGWDSLLHSYTATPYVPLHYIEACIGFDIVISGYIFWLASSKIRLQQHQKMSSRPTKVL